MGINVQDIAAFALDKMQQAGFHASQIMVSVSEQDELNIAHNEASLLRSTEDYQLAFTGIVDERKAGAAISDLDEDAISLAVSELFERAQLAPQDACNAVSAEQEGDFVQGPQRSDLDLLALKVQELLEYRAAQTPKMSIDEGAALHFLSRTWKQPLSW